DATGYAVSHAFLWQAGVMTDLGTLGGLNSVAYGINHLGQVVGSAETAAGETHAFLWDRERGMRDLGVLAGDGSAATGINDAGQVVGNATTGDLLPSGDPVFHAVLWDAGGQIHDLGVPPGGFVLSFATAIN